MQLAKARGDYMAYFVVYNNMSNLDLEIEVVKRPLIPMPVRRYKTITIKGHDGNYYSDEETYEDMTFPIQFNFLEEDLDNIRRKVRRIRAWIENASDNKLILSDNNGYYYKVCKAEIGEINYENIYEIQSFLINFTVEPYQYILNNEEFILTKEIYNNWDICKPLYGIKGNGACTFTINGININCNVNQELIIDT